MLKIVVSLFVFVHMSNLVRYYRKREYNMYSLSNMSAQVAEKNRPKYPENLISHTKKLTVSSYLNKRLK